MRRETVLLLRIETTKRPHVDPAERLSIEEVGDGIYRGVARFGFMHPPDIAGALSTPELPFDREDAVFFLPRVVVKPAPTWWGGFWRRCYLFLGSTGLNPIEYFQLPPEQVVSVGVELKM